MAYNNTMEVIYMAKFVSIKILLDDDYDIDDDYEEYLGEYLDGIFPKNHGIKYEVKEIVDYAEIFKFLVEYYKEFIK